MSSNILPRHLIVASALALIALLIMLSMFYGQFEWLADSVVDASVEQHDASLSTDFEQHAWTQLHGIASAVSEVPVAEDPTAFAANLERILTENANVTGIRFDSLSGRTFQAGASISRNNEINPSWTPDYLYLGHVVNSQGERAGTLIVEFSLSGLHRESQDFKGHLLDRAAARRRNSFLWTGLTILITLALCGFAILLIARSQIRRIRALKTQAEKFSQADFGEPLDVLYCDELGELADVFNQMRNKLQATTMSRDYVDSVLASMNEAIIITSADGVIKRTNDATSRMLGYDENELLDQPIEQIVAASEARAMETGSALGVPREILLQSKSGQPIPVSYTGSIVEAEHGPTGDKIYAAQNITERRKAEQRIRYLARIDALTKVPNRMQFQHLLQRTIARAKRTNKSVCLLYLDVDHFKDINDTFGHLAGDTTLETVAERLRDALPVESVIGRLAGDEFAVIVDGLESGTNINACLDEMARKLLDRLADPFYVQGNEVFMTASMGIACYPSDAPNVIDLIRNADAALYNAKKSGGNVFSYYVPEMNEAAVERLMTKSKLKRAFERDELLVHYQPKYNIETGEVVGAEALVRWELPERGIILPSDFIPIAEETNLIIEIGEWVIDKVCEDFRFWQKSVSLPGRVSVNLSLKQLRQPNFADRIISILRSYEVSPTSLELEITESTLMEDPVRTIKVLDELYALGLHLAIDDFGTGYSSLSALQQFPINTLKIDKSFVRNVVTDPDDATIVGTIVHMGRSLKMDVVAEGVESEDQLSFLQTLNCTYVQGLLFGNPMSSDNFLELLLAQAEGTDTFRALFA